MLESSARNTCDQKFSEFMETRGVSCFSEVNDGLLMWAHYADKYCGICLEFDTDNELFKKAKKVDYVDELPKIDAVELFLEKGRHEVLNLFAQNSIGRGP